MSEGPTVRKGLSGPVVKWDSKVPLQYAADMPGAGDPVPGVPDAHHEIATSREIA